MKLLFFILTALLFLAGSVLISIQFEAVLYFFVLKIGFGWVYSSIYIRIIVAFLFIIGINSIFKIFQKTKKIKKWVTILIGVVPGFFVSFIISPIYDIDYGLLDDKLKLEHFTDLSEDTNFSYSQNDKHELIAFLDVGCGHCEMALKKMNANFTNGQNAPIHLFFHNDSSDVNHFLDINNSSQLNHHYMLSEGLFLKHAGFEFPSIYLINTSGETVFHWVGDEMNYSALDYLLSLEQ